METANLMSRNNQVDLWEAWVDLQIIGSKQYTTLYVMGEVPGSKQQAAFLAKTVNSIEPRILKLELNTDNDNEDVNTEELYYYEILRDVNQYQGVVIFNNGELISSIDIELVND